jgi:hypothetical protein
LPSLASFLQNMQPVLEALIAAVRSEFRKAEAMLAW